MAGEHFAPAVVRRMTALAPDICVVELVPRAGTVAYPAGSHLDLALEIDGLPDTRSYSLVGAGPLAGAYRIAVKRLIDSRGGSAQVHEWEAGHQLLISAPQSHFEPNLNRPEYLLIAGGIGITPLVGMAEVLTRLGRPVRLAYAVHDRTELVFETELTELLGESLTTFVSTEGGRLDLDSEIGRLDPDAELLLCGPPRLRDAAQRTWRQQGRRPDRLRFETFASGGRFPAAAFRARVHDHGDLEVEVGADRTLLDALARRGVEVMSDCLRGECGLCAVRVLACDGELDHRDVFLSEAEQSSGDTLLACVSRLAGGSVTIDTGFRSPAEGDGVPSTMTNRARGEI